MELLEESQVGNTAEVERLADAAKKLKTSGTKGIAKAKNSARKAEKKVGNTRLGTANMNTGKAVCPDASKVICPSEFNAPMDITDLSGDGIPKACSWFCQCKKCFNCKDGDTKGVNFIARFEATSGMSSTTKLQEKYLSAMQARNGKVKEVTDKCHAKLKAKKKDARKTVKKAEKATAEAKQATKQAKEEASADRHKAARKAEDAEQKEFFQKWWTQADALHQVNAVNAIYSIPGSWQIVGWLMDELRKLPNVKHVVRIRAICGQYWHAEYSKASEEHRKELQQKCGLNVGLKVQEGTKTVGKHNRVVPRYLHPTFWVVITRAGEKAVKTDPLIWSRVASSHYFNRALTAEESAKWEGLVRETVAKFRFKIVRDVVEGVLTGDAGNAPCPCGYIKKSAQKPGGQWGPWGQCTTKEAASISECAKRCALQPMCLSFGWDESTKKCGMNKKGLSELDGKKYQCMKVRQKYKCGNTAHDFKPAPTPSPVLCSKKKKKKKKAAAHAHAFSGLHRSMTGMSPRRV